MPVDVFSSLLEFTYNGISAPVVMFKERFAHDMPEHKKTDRDGSTSEGTGRGAFIFNVKLAFINGLARGPNETWSSLYPQTYNNFVKELLKRDTGFMAHPERGLLDVKVLDMESEINPDQRGGRYLDVQFRETDDSTAVLASAAFTNLSTAAGDLTSALGALNPPLPLYDADGLSLFDLISDIASISATIDLLEKKISLRIDNFVGQLDGILASPPPDPQIPTILPLVAAVAQGLRDQKKQLLVANQPTKFYLTKSQMTSAHLALVLKSSVQDLLTLNPQIGGLAQIPVASVVRYYA